MPSDHPPQPHDWAKPERLVIDVLDEDSAVAFEWASNNCPDPRVSQAMIDFIRTIKALMPEGEMERRVREMYERRKAFKSLMDRWVGIEASLIAGTLVTIEQAHKARRANLRWYERPFWRGFFGVLSGK